MTGKCCDNKTQKIYQRLSVFSLGLWKSVVVSPGLGSAACASLLLSLLSVIFPSTDWRTWVGMLVWMCVPRVCGARETKMQGHMGHSGVPVRTTVWDRNRKSINIYIYMEQIVLVLCKCRIVVDSLQFPHWTLILGRDQAAVGGNSVKMRSHALAALFYHLFCFWCLSLSTVFMSLEQIQQWFVLWVQSGFLFV